MRVQAASVNPGDWKVQKGMLRPLLPRLPFAPGASTLFGVGYVTSCATPPYSGTATLQCCYVQPKALGDSSAAAQGVSCSGNWSRSKGGWL